MAGTVYGGIKMQKRTVDEEFYYTWYTPYLLLTDEEKAWHKLQVSDVYRKHELAKKYGKQLYNRYGRSQA